MQLPTKIGVAGAVLSVVGIGFGWGIFPWFLNMQIAKAKGLVPGSETRDMWEKLPFPLDFKIHVFNVTNYLAVQNGDVPMLDEIGPYYYDEWKEKAEVVDYEDDDTVTFHMKNTFIFNQEKSGQLTGKEVVVVPHPVLVGLISAAERTKPGTLGLVNKALPLLFNQPETVFLKTTVHDLLFGGNVINCTSKEFAANAVCTFLKKGSKDLEKLPDNTFKFSIFGMKNATSDSNKFQVSRGIVDFKTVGEMVTFNGKKKMSYWRGKPCNDLTGTDSTIFPPFTKPEEDVVAFSHDICRSIASKFQRHSNYKGIPTLRYTGSLGDMSTEPSLKCYCLNDTYCLKKGVMDLMPCTGAPAIASLPHFYDSHEDYVKSVRGLHPEEDKHGLVFDLEPMTGSPVFAKKRLQFSLPIYPINKIDLSTNLPTLFLPFMWVEEGVAISDEFVAKINSQLFKIIQAVDIIRWLLTVFGVAILGGGVGLYYKRQNNLSISPSTTANRKMDTPNDFSGDKKPHNDFNGGNDNYGYI